MMLGILDNLRHDRQKTSKPSRLRVSRESKRGKENETRDRTNTRRREGRAPREGARSISRFRGSASRANINTGRARPAFPPVSLQGLFHRLSDLLEGLLVLTARSPDAYVDGPCDCQEASFEPSPAFHREDSAVPSTPTSSSSSSSSSLPSSSLPSGMIDSNQCVIGSSIAPTVNLRTPSIAARATSTTNRREFARGRDPACPVGRAMLAAAAARSMTEAALPLHLLHVLRTFTPTSERGLLSRRRRTRSFRLDSFFSFPRSDGSPSRKIDGSFRESLPLTPALICSRC